MSKRNDKMTKFDVAVVVFLVVLVALAGVIAYNAEPVKAPEHGSYLKCDFRTVKGACGRWSVGTY